MDSSGRGRSTNFREDHVARDDGPEAALAQFASSFPYEAIPAPVIRQVKLLLIDAVGCALAGDLAEETEQVATAAQALGGGEHTVIGRPERLSSVGATLLNSYLMTAMTVCDVYRPAHCHIANLVVPPAMVAGAQAGSSGRDFLTAVAVGMETTVRVAVGLDYPAFRARGWHSPGVVGPFGSAATVGRLLRFDRDVMRHALGLAGTQSAGSYLSWGTPAVKFHQARGAVSGLIAATLADQGFPGGPHVLTAPDGGVFHTHSNGGDPDSVTADLGERWELEQISLRLWPGASPVQAMLTALFDVIDTDGATAAAVEAVEIGIAAEDFATHQGFTRPTGTFEALLSYAFLASAALHDRQVSFAQVLHPRYEDPTLLAFAEHRVRLVPVEGMEANGCTLQVRFTDGSERTRVVTAARGTPQNPASEDEVRAKFHRCADRRLGRSRAMEVLEMLADIESQRDIRFIGALTGDDLGTAGSSGDG
jgi:2-methylcitrate dehydratase PrpD